MSWNATLWTNAAMSVPLTLGLALAFEVLRRKWRRRVPGHEQVSPQVNPDSQRCAYRITLHSSSGKTCRAVPKR